MNRFEKEYLIWKNLISSQEYQTIILDFRKKIKSLPKDGLHNYEGFCKWKKNATIPEKKLFNNELEKAKKAIKNKYSFLNLKNCGMIIMNSLIFKELPKSRIKESRILYHQLFYSQPNNVFPKELKKPKAGIYIHVSPFSSITDLKSFIDKKADIIKNLQKWYKQKSGSSQKQLKPVANSERDGWVISLWNLEKEDLKDLGGGSSNYKDIMIEKLLKDWGIADISSDNIRRIASRKHVT